MCNLLTVSKPTESIHARVDSKSRGHVSKMASAIRGCLISITIACLALRCSPLLCYVEKCAKRIFPHNIKVFCATKPREHAGIKSGFQFPHPRRPLRWMLECKETIADGLVRERECTWNNLYKSTSTTWPRRNRHRVVAPLPP